MISFRAAVAEDAARVADLVNSGYRGESSKRGWTTEADLLGGQRTDAEGVLDMLREPSSRVELAFDDESLVGCVYLKRQADGACYLGMLTVDPTRQAGGLGKRLMERSEALAGEWGCARMRMTVLHSREELLRYYERRGYTLTGEFEPFPYDQPRFGLPKVQGLKLLEMVKDLPAAVPVPKR